MTPAGRFRPFDYDELIKRDRDSFEIFWLNDESPEDSANLPDPEMIGLEIAEDFGSRPRSVFLNRRRPERLISHSQPIALSTVPVEL
jgi:hypothetical protein